MYSFLSISGQYLSFCLPWASVDFMDSFICHFTFRVNKICGLATCLFWYTPDWIEWEHKHFFKLSKALEGLEQGVEQSHVRETNRLKQTTKSLLSDILGTLQCPPTINAQQEDVRWLKMENSGNSPLMFPLSPATIHNKTPNQTTSVDSAST